MTNRSVSEEDFFLILFGNLQLLLIEPFLRELLAIFLSQEGLVVYKKIVINVILHWAIHKWSPSIREIIAVEYQEHLLHNGISSNAATYKDFLELISKSDIREFIINKYPVFMDRLKHCANLFCSFISELLYRFKKDQALITEKLFSSQTAGNTTFIAELTDIWVAGDTHNRGKSVAILTVCYQDQLFKAVYKPRDFSLDLALNEVYRFLNSTLTYSLKIPIIIPQDHYFWSEYFKHAGCNEQSEIEEFYYRFGALTFVCYVLGGE